MVEGAGLGLGGNCAADGDGRDEEARRDGSRRSAVSVRWGRFWGIVGGEGRPGEGALALKPEPGGSRLIEEGSGEGVVFADPPTTSLRGTLLPFDEPELSFFASVGVSAFFFVLSSFRGMADFLTSGKGIGEARPSVWVGVVLRTRSISPVVGRGRVSARYCAFKVHTWGAGESVFFLDGGGCSAIYKVPQSVNRYQRGHVTHEPQLAASGTLFECLGSDYAQGAI